MDKPEEKKTYLSPKAETVDLHQKGVLCASGVSSSFQRESDPGWFN